MPLNRDEGAGKEGFTALRIIQFDMREELRSSTYNTTDQERLEISHSSKGKVLMCSQGCLPAMPCAKPGQVKVHGGC